MSGQRVTILTMLALLTLLFLGAAVYTLVGNPFGVAASDRRLPLEAPRALRLTVRETGIVAISYEQLRETKLEFEALSPAFLSLTRDGEQVPFYVDGEGEDATLYFFSQAITRSVEAPAVYWLRPGSGRPMKEVNRSPVGSGSNTGWRQRHWEENDTFVAQASGDDIWLGQNLFAPGSLEIPLNDLQATGGPGELRIRVWSSNQSTASPDHHLQVWLNNKQLTSYFWDGISQETLNLPLQSGILAPANNVLTLNVPGDTGAAGESIYVDWIRLHYEGELALQGSQLLFSSDAQNIQINGAGEETLVFDISDPQEPVRLSGGQVEEESLQLKGNGPESHYLALNPLQAIRPYVELVQDWPEPLQTAERGADYIAIVPDATGFDEALRPLLDYRRQQGMRVAAVDLQQIYDEFAHGRETPDALRTFLSYARQSWQPPAPRFVLLVGDTTYDVNNYLGKNPKNLLPTHLVYTQYAGYVASDTWFTIFDQQRPLPTMAIGRLPAQSDDQLAVMVEKTVTYESTAGADWLQRALLVADDETRFNTASDWLATQLQGKNYETQKLYMTQNEDIRDAIISAINHGVGIVNYVGHGGIDVWGDEMVLRNEDTDLLMNGERLPIFTTFTCLNGFFNHPQQDALAETLLWTTNGGVVAAIAPSGRSFTSQQTPLAHTFYRTLLQDEGITLGEALLAAKQASANDPNLAEVIHTLNLLGDPALRFHTAPTSLQP